MKIILILLSLFINLPLNSMTPDPADPTSLEGKLNTLHKSLKQLKNKLTGLKGSLGELSDGIKGIPKGPPPPPLPPINLTTPLEQAQPIDKSQKEIIVIKNINDLNTHLQETKQLNLNQVEELLKLVNESQSTNEFFLNKVKKELYSKTFSGINNITEDIKNSQTEKEQNNKIDTLIPPLKALIIYPPSEETFNTEINKLLSSFKNPLIIDNIVEKMNDIVTSLPTESVNSKIRENIIDAQKNSLQSLKQLLDQSFKKNPESMSKDLQKMLSIVRQREQNPLLKTEQASEIIIQSLRDQPEENQNKFINALINIIEESSQDLKKPETEQNPQSSNYITTFPLIFRDMSIPPQEQELLREPLAGNRTAQEQAQDLIKAMKSPATNEQLMLLTNILSQYEKRPPHEANILKLIIITKKEEFERMSHRKNIPANIKTILKTATPSEYHNILGGILDDISKLTEKEKNYPLIVYLRDYTMKMKNSPLLSLTSITPSVKEDSTSSSATTIPNLIDTTYTFITDNPDSKELISQRIWNLLDEKSDDEKTKFFNELITYMVKEEADIKEADKKKTVFEVILQQIQPSDTELATFTEPENAKTLKDKARIDAIISHLEKKEEEILKNNKRLKLLNQIDQIAQTALSASKEKDAESAKKENKKKVPTEIQKSSKTIHLLSIVDIIEHKKKQFDETIRKAKKEILLPENKQKELEERKSRIMEVLDSRLEKIISELDSITINDDADEDEDEKSKTSKDEKHVALLFELHDIINRKDADIDYKTTYKQILYDTDLHQELNIRLNVQDIKEAIRQAIYTLHKNQYLPQKKAGIKGILEAKLGGKADASDNPKDLSIQDNEAIKKNAQQILDEKNKEVIQKRRKKVMTLLQVTNKTDEELKKLIGDDFIEYRKLASLDKNMRYPDDSEFRLIKEKAQEITDHIFQTTLLSEIKEPTIEVEPQPANVSVKKPESSPSKPPQPAITQPSPKSEGPPPPPPNWTQSTKSASKSSPLSSNMPKQTEEYNSKIRPIVRDLNLLKKDLELYKNKAKFTEANNLYAQATKLATRVDPALNDEEIEKIKTHIKQTKSLIKEMKEDQEVASGFNIDKILAKQAAQEEEEEDDGEWDD